MRTFTLISAVSLICLVSSCASRKNGQESRSATDLTSGNTEMADSPAVIVTGDTTAITDTAGDQKNIDVNNGDTGMISYLGEQAIIYKTTKDYSRYVPVTMDASRTKIISYPSPKDVYYKGKLALPVKLNKGFWLDNRGINANSVFLKITYEDYAKLREAPLLKDMMTLVEDKNPVTEIYSLGNRSRFKDEVNEINGIIDRDALKKFRRIK